MKKVLNLAVCLIAALAAFSCIESRDSIRTHPTEAGMAVFKQASAVVYNDFSVMPAASLVSMYVNASGSMARDSIRSLYFTGYTLAVDDTVCKVSGRDCVWEFDMGRQPLSEVGAKWNVSARFVGSFTWPILPKGGYTIECTAPGVWSVRVRQHDLGDFISEADFTMRKGQYEGVYSIDGNGEMKGTGSKIFDIDYRTTRALWSNVEGRNFQILTSGVIPTGAWFMDGAMDISFVRENYPSSEKVVAEIVTPRPQYININITYRGMTELWRINR